MTFLDFKLHMRIKIKLREGQLQMHKKNVSFTKQSVLCYKHTILELTIKTK